MLPNLQGQLPHSAIPPDAKPCAHDALVYMNEPYREVGDHALNMLSTSRHCKASAYTVVLLC